MGSETTLDTFVEYGERAFNLCRVFNGREGVTHKDDKLPNRFMDPLPDGPCKGEAIKKAAFERMLQYYYEIRGWNVETGIPTKRRLEELNLHDL